VSPEHPAAAAPGKPATSPEEPATDDIDLSEVPAVVEVQRFLGRSDPGGAVRAALPLIMVDVQRVYSLSFPIYWTARDVLAHGLRPDMGRLPDLLFQLYSIYEPVRFGERRDWVPGDLLGIVRRIYTETGLRSVVGVSRDAPRRLNPTTFSVISAGSSVPGSTAGGKPW